MAAANPYNGEFTVMIKLMSGDTIEILVTSAMTVRGLKQKIVDTGVTPATIYQEIQLMLVDATNSSKFTILGDNSKVNKFNIGPDNNELSMLVVPAPESQPRGESMDTFRRIMAGAPPTKSTFPPAQLY